MIARPKSELRRLRLALLVALVAATAMAGLQARQPTSAPVPPNIVLIIMDDLGYGDIGSYGVPDAKTPHIDRLAREGVKLTDFYANGANCSPTRAGFISGRYQQRVGIEMPLGAGASDADRGLMPSGTSLGTLLQTRGYATALIGKWHLGWKPEFHPNRHGFAEFWGFLGGYLDYYNNLGPGRVPGAPEQHDLYHNDQQVKTSTYFTDEITTHATSFIESHARDSFFIEVAYNATHWPFQPPGLPENQRSRPDPLHDGTRADYVAMLERADRGVGEILATLDRLRLARNSLVIFTSDNGGEWLSRNAPLFHRKSTLWEGGIRVPALLRWPGQLPAGTVSKQVGITMDLTASMLAAAGVTPPASYRPDGINLLPLLKERRLVERTLFWRIKNTARDQKAVRRGRWKYLRDGVGRLDSVHEFLFDLEKDPGERQDFTVARAQMLPVFRKLIADWEADVDAGRASTQTR
jgi:arylsulfatase A-like enzyme